MATSTPSRQAPSMAAQSPARGAGTPLSPTRISRLQEKEELRHLNDRLAVYIDRVRSLELENDRLMVKISEKEEVTTREVSVIKDLYEAELADARKVLDETARHRAKLQIELGKYRSDLEELTKNFKKKDVDLSTAQNRIRDLEALHFRSEAELSASLEEKRKLEIEVTDLRAQLAKAEDAHAVAKKQLEQETLMRVDMENRCQSLQEELEFRKSIYAEESRETRKRHDRSLVEVDRGNKYDYESKLAQALDELRKQHDEQVGLYKEELEQTYQAKLDNIKRSCDHNDQAAEATREELMEARMRIETLGYQLSNLQKQANTAEDRIRELEQLLSSDREKYRKMLDGKEKEIAGLRDLIQQQISEYQELLDVKYALDMEINAYRKLLEGEEERLKLSPSPQSHVTVSRATSSSSSSAARQSRSSKRKRVEESIEGVQYSSTYSKHTSHGLSTAGRQEGVGDKGSSSKFHISQQSSAAGSVTVEESDDEGNFVHLKNNSDQDQSLGNWRLKIKVGDKEEIIYKFTPKYVLRAGQSVKIYSADAGVAHSPPSVLVWKNQSAWGIDSDVKFSLVNSDDELVTPTLVVGNSPPNREIKSRAMWAQSSVTDTSAELAWRTISRSSLTSVEEDGEEAEFGDEDLFHQQGDPRTKSTSCSVM